MEHLPTDRAGGHWCPTDPTDRKRGCKGGATPLGGQIEAPRKIQDIAPVYPELARQARVQGVVILECTISPQGHGPVLPPLDARSP